MGNDELSLTGYFLTEGRLPVGDKQCSIDSSYANQFDDLYFAKLGIETHYSGKPEPGGAWLDVAASVEAGQPVFLDPASEQS